MGEVNCFIFYLFLTIFYELFIEDLGKCYFLREKKIFLEFYRSLDNIKNKS